MKGDRPSPFPLSPASFFPLSPLSTLTFSPFPSPRAPRVALPWGLAPNHPQLVGGNRRLPAGCLVIADPRDARTHTHIPTHKLKTYTHNHIYAYQGICCYLLASLHPRLPHLPNSILPRPQPHHINWITEGGLPQRRPKSLARPRLQTGLN